ncbi:MAG: hypothetical protein ACI4XI_00510 [Ruminococcus sp.]
MANTVRRYRTDDEKWYLASDVEKCLIPEIPSYSSKPTYRAY